MTKTPDLNNSSEIEKATDIAKTASNIVKAKVVTKTTDTSTKKAISVAKTAETKATDAASTTEVATETEKKNETIAKPKTLPGFQARYLRGLANPLKAALKISNAELTPPILFEIEQALNKSELIKIRLHHPKNKKAQATQLAIATDSYLCGLIGHTIILYHPNPNTPTIQLPKKNSKN